MATGSGTSAEAVRSASASRSARRLRSVSNGCRALGSRWFRAILSAASTSPTASWYRPACSAASDRATASETSRTRDACPRPLATRTATTIITTAASTPHAAKIAPGGFVRGAATGHRAASEEGDLDERAAGLAANSATGRGTRHRHHLPALRASEGTGHPQDLVREMRPIQLRVQSDTPAARPIPLGRFKPANVRRFRETSDLVDASLIRSALVDEPGIHVRHHRGREAVCTWVGLEGYAKAAGPERGDLTAGRARSVPARSIRRGPPGFAATEPPSTARGRETRWATSR